MSLAKSVSIITDTVDYYPDFVPTSLGSYEGLLAQIKPVLSQHTIKVWNKDVKEPRLGAFFSLGGVSGYRYSKTKRPVFNLKEYPLLMLLQEHCSKTIGVDFNSCLVNWYRDGNDYIGEHSDDEKDLKKSNIASISLGSVRDFILKSKTDKNDKKIVSMASGCMIHMYGECQKLYKHSVPKRRKVTTGRLNITFRVV